MAVCQYASAMTIETTKRTAQAADKYIVRLPPGMRDEIAAAAKANSRSMNSEIIDRLQRSFEGGATGLEEFSDAVLLDAVLARYGGKLQLIISPENAGRSGLEVPRTKAN